MLPSKLQVTAIAVPTKATQFFRIYPKPFAIVRRNFLCTLKFENKFLHWFGAVEKLFAPQCCEARSMFAANACKVDSEYFVLSLFFPLAKIVAAMRAVAVSAGCSLVWMSAIAKDSAGLLFLARELLNSGGVCSVVPVH